MEILASITWLLIGFVTSYYANQRGRNPIAWFLLGLFFGVLSTIALFLIPDLSKESPKLSPQKEPSITNEHVIDPNDSKEWFYEENQQQQGPISYTILKLLKDKGTITEDSYVWSEGMSEWIKFKDL